MVRTTLLLAAAIALAACDDGPAPASMVAGTWGGVDAGFIVNDSGAHVHIGCTLGDISGPIHVDPSGHFQAGGTFNVNAYPVNLSILHPATFTGQIFGNTMLLTVRLTDTTVTLGPASLTRGVQPQMGPCPICRSPGDMLGVRAPPHVAGH